MEQGKVGDAWLSIAPDTKYVIEIELPTGQKHRLKPRQLQLCLAMAEILSERDGVPPTVRDLAAATGVSTSATHYNLNRLVQFGLLVREGTSKGQTWRMAGARWVEPDWVGHVRAASQAMEPADQEAAGA